MKEILQVDKIKLDTGCLQSEVSMVRCDLYDKDIPGNKFWKMKYNITEMSRRAINHMVTFGGAYSNHISAVAEAGKKFGFQTTAFIRGEESKDLNHTLSVAQKNGMKLHYIDRETYRIWKKGGSTVFDFLGDENIYVLPEGGSNVLAVKGFSEIMPVLNEKFDIICCPVGSGATLAGLIVSSGADQLVIGFSSLKGGEYLETEIFNLLKQYDAEYGTNHAAKTNWKLIHKYHFGGFAKTTDEVIAYYREFKSIYNIELDLVYTAKMMFGLREMLSEGFFKPDDRIAAIHTGGVQGNESLLK